MMSTLRRRPKNAPPRRDRSAEFASYTAPASRGRMAVDLSAGAEPVEKERALQHEGYMAAVRLLPCARCRLYRPGLIQFCHADEGKGQGIKTDCRRGWPGCGPHDGLPGCHWVVGTSGTLTREERRLFEADAGAQTRAEIIRRGLWPARLPRWPE